MFIFIPVKTSIIVRIARFAPSFKCKKLKYNTDVDNNQVAGMVMTTSQIIKTDMSRSLLIGMKRCIPRTQIAYIFMTWVEYSTVS